MSSITSSMTNVMRRAMHVSAGVVFGYNKHMERAVDKTIIIICCFAALLLIEQSTAFVVGLLLVVAISALQETAFVPKRLEICGLYAYLAAALVLPMFAVFVPLIAYDCLQRKNWVLKLCWVLPLGAATDDLSFTVLLFLGVVSLISCSLSWRTARIDAERLSYTALRDELRGLSLSLEQKNRSLQEKQDYEVRLATLAERGRIAREIHDNVGHLLTRSVLQIEAAQVVHEDDAALKAEFEQIGATVHEAFDTVRASVHDLHEESFDLYTQLYALAQDSILEVSLEYQVEAVPDTVGYGFAAIVKEAVANTAKHSDASRVQVSLTEYPGFWQLVVHDNGSKDPFFKPTDDEPRRLHRVEAGQKGLFADDPEEAKGIGLATMEERTRSMKGVFKVGYDRGFRVFVSVPKGRNEGKGRSEGKDRSRDEHEKDPGVDRRR